METISGFIYTISGIINNIQNVNSYGSFNNYDYQGTYKYYDENNNLYSFPYQKLANGYFQRNLTIGGDIICNNNLNSIPISYFNNLTSNIQNQLDNKLTISSSIIFVNNIFGTPAPTTPIGIGQNVTGSILRLNCRSVNCTSIFFSPNISSSILASISTINGYNVADIIRLYLANTNIFIGSSSSNISISGFIYNPKMLYFDNQITTLNNQINTKLTISSSIFVNNIYAPTPTTTINIGENVTGAIINLNVSAVNCKGNLYTPTLSVPTLARFNILNAYVLTNDVLLYVSSQRVFIGSYDSIITISGFINNPKMLYFDEQITILNNQINTIYSSTIPQIYQIFNPLLSVYGDIDNSVYNLNVNMTYVLASIKTLSGLIKNYNIPLTLYTQTILPYNPAEIFYIGDQNTITGFLGKTAFNVCYISGEFTSNGITNFLQPTNFYNSVNFYGGLNIINSSQFINSDCFLWCDSNNINNEISIGNQNINKIFIGNSIDGETRLHSKNTIVEGDCYFIGQCFINDVNISYIQSSLSGLIYTTNNNNIYYNNSINSINNYIYKTDISYNTITFNDSLNFNHGNITTDANNIYFTNTLTGGFAYLQTNNGANKAYLDNTGVFVSPYLNIIKNAFIQENLSVILDCNVARNLTAGGTFYVVGNTTIGGTLVTSNDITCPNIYASSSMTTAFLTTNTLVTNFISNPSSTPYGFTSTNIGYSFIQNGTFTGPVVNNVYTRAPLSIIESGLWAVSICLSVQTTTNRTASVFEFGLNLGNVNGWLSPDSFLLYETSTNISLTARAYIFQGGPYYINSTIFNASNPFLFLQYFAIVSGSTTGINNPSFCVKFTRIA